MKRTPYFFLGLLSLAMLQAAASAGPLRDRIQQRIEARPQAASTGIEDGTEDAGGASAPLPPDVRLLRDIPYGNDPAQKMDVYLPAAGPATGGAAPVVFMVHGGAWRIGDKAMSRVVDNKVARWLPKGVAFVSINYRMLPQTDPVAQADDVARALAKAQALASSWGADPARFVLMGHSAGAHLVSMLTADPFIATRQRAGGWLGTVALDSAAFDVPRIMQAPHFPLYDSAFGADPAYWRSASPVHRLTGKPLPLLAVCSTQRQDSCAQAREFVALAVQRGSASDVLPVDLKHGEINEYLGQPGVYTERVEHFLKRLGLPL